MKTTELVRALLVTTSGGLSGIALLAANGWEPQLTNWLQGAGILLLAIALLIAACCMKTEK